MKTFLKMASGITVIAGLVLLISLLVMVVDGLCSVIRPRVPSSPKYIACAAVSASIDGGITYSETNLKRIPLKGYFFLKFDVSVQRRGVCGGDKKFAFTVENKEPGKLEAMELVEYSGEIKPVYTGEKTKSGDTFKIFVSRYRGKNTIIYRCKPPENCPPDTLFQITIKSDDTHHESLNKTIAVVFDP